MLAPKSPDEMTTDATITDAARDHIRSYFAEFGAAGEEFERFVIEQLDHLEACKPGSRIESASWTSTKRRCTASSTTCKQHSSDWTPLAPRSKVGSPNATSGRPRQPRAGRIASARVCRATRRGCAEFSQERTMLGEQIASAHAQAQAQWQSISQTAVAELAQARAELAASSEDLARERQRFAEAAAPLVEAISRPPAPVEQPVPAAVAPEPKPSDTQLPLPAAPGQPPKSALPSPRSKPCQSPRPNRPAGGTNCNSCGAASRSPRRKRPRLAASSRTQRPARKTRESPTSEERALGSILNQFQDLQGELANRPAKQPTTK